ncbi:GNAT family N-acetyltransferase [Pseudalkalibacillus berkeleyi]|uniref:GNAT family N-acetyltransferase n=1 Tax=Pseudalkalibacillus berkeleyi TaxID=1069813 RepID=A0ABS9GXF6_9BACL|nr:GNAT family N-acetyltransferase [Pseudalkalibacillus berkeleyi]MCF6136304.1 GNAT family N-acetyltransferase [Pseudalkalibacillus berkeleyi]
MNITNITGIPDEKTMNEMLLLHERVFGYGADELRNELEKKHNIHIAIAYDEASLVGYKIGYERKSHHFYSWLGGVDPNHRNKGIGQTLLMEQHDWCMKNGYETIRTHTKNSFRSMLILNLKNGFDVIGTFTDRKGEPKIILEKILK